MSANRYGALAEVEVPRRRIDGVGRSANALFLFNDRDGRFSCKKAASSTSLAISKGHRDLNPLASK